MPLQVIRLHSKFGNIIQFEALLLEFDAPCCRRISQKSFREDYALREDFLSSRGRRDRSSIITKISNAAEEGTSKTQVMQFLLRAHRMIELLLSIFTLIASVSIVYLLTSVDRSVREVLYQFDLQFSYDWAISYWMFLRISLALLGLIAVAASLNITYSFWRRQRKLVLVSPVKAELAPPAPTVAPLVPTPSLFQCTSCGRSNTHPLRIQINTCPFCNAPMVPVGYVRMSGQLADLQLDKLKTVVRDYLKAGILTLDDLKVEKKG